MFSGGISCSISYNTVTMAHGAHEPLKAGNWRWLPVEGVKGRRIGDYSNHFVVDSPIHQTKGAVWIVLLCFPSTKGIAIDQWWNFSDPNIANMFIEYKDGICGRYLLNTMQLVIIQTSPTYLPILPRSRPSGNFAWQWTIPMYIVW